MSSTAASHLSPAYPLRAPRGTADKLRAWQQAALEAYLRQDQRDFLAVATPGAGKTTFALRVAAELFAAGTVRAVTVVTPTEHLKRQWADAAHRVGIRLDPEFRNAAGATSREYAGAAVTYAQVAAAPLLHRARTEARPTLVVLDEIHHAGDARAWGEGTREAFEPATRRLALTGTPFRSDTNPIPFVTYLPGPDGVPRSVADVTYGYADALRDGVVRPVIFLAYSGQLRWRTRAGDEVAATLDQPLTRDLRAQAWRTALDPRGEWVPQVLAAADRRLTEVRRTMPDAGGLVIATDRAAARSYARRLAAVSGEPPVVVLSDEPEASARIAAFTTSRDRWMVAVRMVSEGVDVPRLAVGVYATATATPLFFAQAVGRFVRARRRGETASVFLPTLADLLGYAAELEVERDHVLGRPATGEEDLWAPEDGLRAAAERAQTTPDDPGFTALASAATFDRVLYDGGEFGATAAVGSAEEQDYLGLPGLLEPDQVATLLRRRQAAQLAARGPARGTPAGPATGAGTPAGAGTDGDVPAYRRVADLRRELNALVGAWHHRTGVPHGAIHADLRRQCGGPATAQASVEQLQARIALLRRWAARPGSG